MLIEPPYPVNQKLRSERLLIVILKEISSLSKCVPTLLSSWWIESFFFFFEFNK